MDTFKGWIEALRQLSSDEGGTAIERMHPTDQDRLEAFIQSLLDSQLNDLGQEVEKHRRGKHDHHNFGERDKGFDNAIDQVLVLIKSLRQK